MCVKETDLAEIPAKRTEGAGKVVHLTKLIALVEADVEL